MPDANSPNLVICTDFPMVTSQAVVQQDLGSVQSWNSLSNAEWKSLLCV